MARKPMPSEAVTPPDLAIYAAWEDIHDALRNVMRMHPPEVVRWLAENAECSTVRKAAQKHFEVKDE